MGQLVQDIMVACSSVSITIILVAFVFDLHEDLDRGLNVVQDG